MNDFLLKSLVYLSAISIAAYAPAFWTKQKQDLAALKNRGEISLFPCRRGRRCRNVSLHACNPPQNAARQVYAGISRNYYSACSFDLSCAAALKIQKRKGVEILDLTNFSLIYPDAASQNRHYTGADVSDIDMFTLQELGLLEVFNLKNSELDGYFTSDPEVIAYRNEVFGDMLESPEISVVLGKLIPILTDILELRRLESETGDTSSYLESITEIELYISCVDVLHEGLAPLRGRLKSRSFIILADRIAELADSDYYRELNLKLSELTKRVREIKSVTIGVNLDVIIRPESAGVLSVNSEDFRSGVVLEKILRLNFKDDEYTASRVLCPSGKAVG